MVRSLLGRMGLFVQVVRCRFGDYGMVMALLMAAPSGAFGQCPLGDGLRIEAPVTSVQGRFGSALEVGNGRAVVGAPNLSLTGDAYIVSIETGEVLDRLTDSGASSSCCGGFGTSVATDGEIVVVGSPFANSIGGRFSGAALVYDIDTGVMLSRLIQPDPSGPFDSDRFGISVAVGGGVIAVGAIQENSGAGAVYLFDSSGGFLLKIDNPSDDIFNRSLFGKSLAIDGDVLLIGSDNNQTSGGAVYVYDLQLRLFRHTLSSMSVGNNGFGTAIDIHGDIGAISATGFETQGAVFIFDLNDGELINLIQQEPDANGSNFGRALSLAEDHVYIAAQRNIGGVLVQSVVDVDPVSGQVHAEIIPSGPDAAFGYGSAISADGDHLVVGSPNFELDGAVYTYFIESDCDSDGDGLLDDWEINGVPYIDSDGFAQRLILPDADPMHKDLYIEIDSMVGRGFDKVAQVNVVVAFAQAPNALVNNPDGLDGIALHLVVDEENLPLIPFPDNWVQFDMVKANHFGTTAEQGNAPLLEAKAKAYRYCVFGQSHGATDSSGLAELPGNDFMVTLGLWNTPGGTIDQQAGTFMHELGHTLNLGHGGVSNAGVVSNLNNKPNYYSVMNYIWQFPHANYARFWRLDYSHVALATLNEAALVEGNGIDGSDPDFAAAMTPYGDGAEPPMLRWAKADGSPVDWNGNGMTDPSPVGVDLNYHESCVFPCPTVGDVLVGGNDWSNLWYRLSGHGNFADGVHTDTTLDTEMTVEIFDRIAQTPPPPCGDADLNGDGSLNFFDVSAFLTAYLAQDSAADFTGDGLFNFFDVSAFLVAYQTGCP